MGIASATIRSDYDGDGATAAFAVGFKYYDADHVTVIHVNSAGTETTWTRGSEYTLSGDGTAITGQVDVDTSPTDYTPASGEKLVILLDPPNLQEILLPSGNYLDDIEEGMDIIVQQVLNLLDGNNRALQAPLSESSIGNLPTRAARLGKILSFDESTGDPEVVAAADLNLATVSAFMATFLQYDTGTEARDALVAAGTGVANTFTKTQTWTKGADVASANALTLGDGNYFDITGTTAITSIGTKGVGTVVKLHFDAALTLTHHATDLILPGGANITTAAGDEAEFVEYATGDWRCTNFSVAAATPASTSIPTGAGIPFFGTAATVPSGWLLCDGDAVSRTTYSDLFSAIGTLYGVGDGSTTFNLPDLRGRSPLGTNDAGLPNGESGSYSTRNEGDSGGEEDHVLTTGELAAHSHADTGIVAGATLASGANFATGSGGSAGSDTAHNTMHPFLVVNFIIKT